MCGICSQIAFKATASGNFIAAKVDGRITPAPNRPGVEPGSMLNRPKGHSKSWQVAVLETWLPSHGI